LDKEVNSGNLKELNNRYDIFISGSDQIWFPNKEIFNSFYYLEFTDESKLRIAYAPSIGVSLYPDEYKLRVKPLLERFNYLSTREKIGSELLGSFCKRKIESVLDPTLLMTRDEWENIIDHAVKNKEIDEVKDDKYILCYFLGNNPWYWRSVKKIQKKLKCKTVNLPMNWQSMNKADQKEFCNPVGFLQWIKGAEIILSDSFHGTIFSILFKKNFYSFKRFEDLNSNDQNSRIYNLLGLLGLEQRLIDDKDRSFGNPAISIDYTTVDTLLDSLRKSSLTFLHKALPKSVLNESKADILPLDSVRRDFILP
jgi:hypothetical protein